MADPRQPELTFLPEPSAVDCVPPAWAAALPQGLASKPLAQVARERAEGVTVYPAAGRVFAALAAVPPTAVRAVLLGQDPYHEPGQAIGYAFAVPRECRPLPPSLRNILREYHDDLGLPIPAQPDLTRWAAQGVLMLNTTLTVREHAAFSHAKIGWEPFTDAIIRAISQGPVPVCFLLWGNPAQRKIPLIDAARHGILASAHPSPLSASRGFFGSRPFSRANDWLAAHGRPPVDWRLG